MFSKTYSQSKKYVNPLEFSVFMSKSHIKHGRNTEQTQSPVTKGTQIEGVSKNLAHLESFNRTKCGIEIFSH